jgi:transcriptional regulator with XRE-family HTH domain
MLPAGQRLRALREQLGLTIREVEAASLRLAQKYGNPEFALSLSRLSDIETKGVVPSIYRLYSFSVIYRKEIKELLGWYGIDLGQLTTDFELVAVPKTHKLELLPGSSPLRVPLAMDPAFDLRNTTNIGRMIQKWGTVPFAFLAQLADNDYTYGYIGAEDFTMYPLLLPGSFVQVDETDNEITNVGWRSEYERPIFFVETREGYVCCWCTSLDSHQIVLQPHPLSPVAPRVLKHPQEAEVIGKVVAVAMRLDDLSFSEPSGPKKARPALN